MKLFNTGSITRVTSQNEIFIGAVTAAQIATEENAQLLRVTLVTFNDGSRNRMHHHGADQVLVITEGAGIIANEKEELMVTPGDIVLIPAGEHHWHGAQPGQSMAHLSILTPGDVTIDEPAP